MATVARKHHTITSVLDDMRRDLSCALCGEVMESATTTPCQHHFCSSCITHDDVTSCPICHLPFWRKDLRPDPAIVFLVESYLKMQDIIASKGRRGMESYGLDFSDSEDDSTLSDDDEKPSRKQVMDDDDDDDEAAAALASARAASDAADSRARKVAAKTAGRSGYDEILAILKPNGPPVAGSGDGNARDDGTTEVERTPRTTASATTGGSDVPLYDRRRPPPRVRGTPTTTTTAAAAAEAMSLGGSSDDDEIVVPRSEAKQQHDDGHEDDEGRARVGLTTARRGGVCPRPVLPPSPPRMADSSSEASLEDLPAPTSTSSAPYKYPLTSSPLPPPTATLPVVVCLTALPPTARASALSICRRWCIPVVRSPFEATHLVTAAAPPSALSQGAARRFAGIAGALQQRRAVEAEEALESIVAAGALPRVAAPASSSVPAAASTASEGTKKSSRRKSSASHAADTALLFSSPDVSTPLHPQCPFSGGRVPTPSQLLFAKRTLSYVRALVAGRVIVDVTWLRALGRWREDLEQNDDDDDDEGDESDLGGGSTRREYLPDRWWSPTFTSAPHENPYLVWGDIRGGVSPAPLLNKELLAAARAVELGLEAPASAFTASPLRWLVHTGTGTGAGAGALVPPSLLLHNVTLFVPPLSHPADPTTSQVRQLIRWAGGTVADSACEAREAYARAHAGKEYCAGLGGAGPRAPAAKNTESTGDDGGNGGGEWGSLTGLGSMDIPASSFGVGSLPLSDTLSGTPKAQTPQEQEDSKLEHVRKTEVSRLGGAALVSPKLLLPPIAGGAPAPAGALEFAAFEREIGLPLLSLSWLMDSICQGAAKPLAEYTGADVLASGAEDAGDKAGPASSSSTALGRNSSLTAGFASSDAEHGPMGAGENGEENELGGHVPTTNSGEEDEEEVMDFSFGMSQQMQDYF